MSENNKLKVARAVTFFCVFPTAIFVVTFSLENIDSFRPHGTTAFTLFCYGVLVPAIFFFINKKLLNFSKNKISNLLLPLKQLIPKPQIHPIVYEEMY